MNRMIHKLIQYLATGPALFFFQFNTHSVGAVKSHFNTRKKTHQQDSKDKPDNDAYFKHGGVKIEKDNGGRKSKVEFLISRNNEFTDYFFCFFAGMFELIIHDDFMKLGFKGKFIGRFIYPGIKTFGGFRTPFL